MSQDLFTQADELPRFNANDSVLAYWEALRDLDPQQAEVPLRSALDPRGIQSALPYAFVLERITPRVARVRIAGSKVNDAFGSDMRGLPITALISPEKRSRFSDMLKDVFHMPAMARINLMAERDKSQRCVGQMLLLPLRDDSGEVSRVLGCMELMTLPKRLQKRFKPMGAIIKPIGPSGHTGINSLRNRALRVVSSQGGLKPTAPKGSDKGHLKLVVSNEES